MQKSPARKCVRDDPEVRRAQILDAAIRIIGERGYYGFAVHDLAQRCGLTTGGLLYHFKTKEELFLAVLGEYERRTEAALQALIDNFAAERARNPAGGLDVALRLLRAMMEQAVAQPELERLFTVLQAEAMHATHPGYAYFHTFEDRLLQGLVRIVTGYTPEPLPAARQTWALMQGLTQQWLRAEGRFDLLAEWDRAIARLLPDDGTRTGAT
jgi:AcrR family transcriptional regulator